MVTVDLFRLKYCRFGGVVLFEMQLNKLEIDNVLVAVSISLVLGYLCT